MSLTDFVRLYQQLRAQVPVSIVNWGEVVKVYAVDERGGLFVFGDRDLLKEAEGLTWAKGWNTAEADALRAHHCLAT